MTKFEDGPAAGKVLQLRRAPLFLRVVQDSRGEFDGLDQPGDVPRPDETVMVYVKASSDGIIHLDSRNKDGQPNGRWFPLSTYTLFAEQPEDAVVRNNETWAAWALAHAAEMQKRNA